MRRVYKVKETLDDVLTLQVKSIDLPRNGVIDSIALLAKITLSNSGSSDATVKMEDVLKAINEIRVVSNGNVVHYALRGTDIAYLNIYDTHGKALSLDDTVTVPANETKDVRFLIMLDAGQIHALIKDQLQIRVDWNTNVAENVSVNDASIKVTLDKEVYESAEEYVMTYSAGEYGEVFIEEPKVYAIEKSFNALGELTEVFELPVGSVLKRALLVFYDDTGARADIVDKYALVRTRPARIQLYKIDYETSRELDKVQYKLPSVPTGMTMFDYDKEVVFGGLDLREEASGTFKIALKTTNSGKLRYISHEVVPQAIRV
uniref:Major capsid protein, double jelly roll fold protein n=1 Tax=Thermococcus nautili TaxID=195522 RepID=U3RPN5_9EURY|nr:Major capsid protein, double jelly roll fold protein [Thermococcus nautili]